MATLTGSVLGHIKSQSALVVPDQSGHELILAETTGTQKSSDPNWSDASLAYTSVTDIIDGKGTRPGYYVNTRSDGDRDWGTFEGRITTVNNMRMVDGAYQNTGGTGKFRGLSGSGTFKSRSTSPRNVEVTCTGTYHLAASKAAS
jgi:hypothetical protein